MLVDRIALAYRFACRAGDPAFLGHAGQIDAVGRAPGSSDAPSTTLALRIMFSKVGMVFCRSDSSLVIDVSRRSRPVCVTSTPPSPSSSAWPWRSTARPTTPPPPSPPPPGSCGSGPPTPAAAENAPSARWSDTRLQVQRAWNRSAAPCSNRTTEEKTPSRLGGGEYRRTVTTVNGSFLRTNLTNPDPGNWARRIIRAIVSRPRRRYNRVLVVAAAQLPPHRAPFLSNNVETCDEVRDAWNGLDGCGFRRWSLCPGR